MDPPPHHRREWALSLPHHASPPRSEFWTPTPLPSIAASDPRFENKEGNNWSGPPEGLTYQRAIRALESYGHHAELVLLGERQRQPVLRFRVARV